MNKAKRKLSDVFIAGIIIVLLVFGIIADAIGYYQFTQALTAQYQDNAISIAKVAASEIDSYLLLSFKLSGGKCYSYKTTSDRMQKLCDRMNAEFIYVIEVDQSDYGEIEFLFEVVNKDSAFPPYEVGVKRQTTNAEYAARYKELYEGTIDSAIVVRDKGFIETGSHVTALVPIEDRNGDTVALLAVQRQMEFLDSGRINYVKSILLASILLIVVSGTSVFLILRKRVLKPIEEISKETIRFASENTPAKTKLSKRVKTNDELGLLASSIDTMEKKTINYFTELSNAVAEKNKVEAELNLAAGIQASMLPSTFPAFPDHSEFDIYASMDPAKEVGGDFYDFFMIDESHLAIVVADVSGKGVPASLFMVIAKTLIKDHTRLGTNPGKVFERVNKLLCESNKEEMFVTAFEGILDLKTGQLEYVNAGHEIPFICRKGGVFAPVSIKSNFVLAGFENVKYETGILTLNPGDKLFEYTDGAPEATDAGNQLYGMKRLEKVLAAHSNDSPADILPAVKADIEEFVGQAPQFDDITMLCLEYKG